MMSDDAVYEARREVRTFADLYQGADVLLELAKSGMAGSYHTTMAALLMTAFTFEAYLNHIGAEKIAYWPEMESISITKKHSALCKLFGVSHDKSQRPGQTIKKLFDFRNSIAHGKSFVLQETRDVPLSFIPPFQHPPAPWEEYCTVDNAERAMEDVGSAIADLHKAAGYGDAPFLSGRSTFSLISKKR